jgi:aminopeptidase-like protein/aminoglycoside N3'-acetyltransferase
MSQAHYTREELVAAIRAVGVTAGDVVSLQVSLGRLGLPHDTPPHYVAISNLVVDAILGVIGPTGTLIVPTYTYSIGRGETYVVEETPSAIGDFTEIFRRRSGVVRSRDPMLSAAGIGPKAHEILRTISRSCYGTDSAFHRLREVDAKICTLGISLYWATFRHHIEEMANVPFRFRKAFHGAIREEGVAAEETWIYFAAPLQDCCAPVGLPLEQTMRAAGLVKVAPVGRGELMVINARAYFDHGLAELGKAPWLTAKGPPCGSDELLTREDERVGATDYRVALEPGASMARMIEAVWKLPRDCVSSGYDCALSSLARQIPMVVHEYPSGTDCDGQIAPEKWTCRDGYLATVSGSQLFSYRDCALHVASHSFPIDKVVSRDELFRHLHVHPRLMDAVPYRDVAGRRDWGLCCSQEMRSRLGDEEYRVMIDSAFSYGALKVGDAVIRGESDDTILLCAQLGTPAQANSGLTGCVVAIEVMRRLAKLRRPRCTYRLLVVPDAVGIAAYLAANEGLGRCVKGGVFIDHCGLRQNLALRPSLDPLSPFDQCCLTALRAHDPELRLEHEADAEDSVVDPLRLLRSEMPVVMLSRRQQGSPYAEYCSNLDTPDLVANDRLEDTCDAIVRVVESWERAETRVPT